MTYVFWVFTLPTWVYLLTFTAIALVSLCRDEMRQPV